MTEALLTCRLVGKNYGDTTVLRDVDLKLARGEVLAILGENGAGKSTLMKIISGLIPAGSYTGSVELEGVACSFGSARDASAAGVVMVPQELHVVPHLTIAENMFAGALPSRFGLYDARRAVEMARDALAVFGVDVDPAAPAAVMSPSERRLIVLAAALSTSARVLVLDEPTAALADAEADTLLNQINKIRATGVGVLYITHRLDELDRVADRSVVLRNGAVTAEFAKSAPRPDLVTAMLGSALAVEKLRRHHDPAQQQVGTPALTIDALTVHGVGQERRSRVVGASLQIWPGEIVGLYGLVGAGRTELARALFGTWPGQVSGTCVVGETSGLPRTPGEAIARGMTLLVEDRKSQGIMPGLSVKANMNAAVLQELRSGVGFVDTRREQSRTAELIKRLGVRPARSDIAIEHLSGGNQQKVLLGRCLTNDLRVLVLDEPTLGVDVGARKDIYQLIRDLARRLRVAVLFISSDVDEVLAETDRVLVMYSGRIRREFPADAPAHDLLSAATGA